MYLSAPNIWGQNTIKVKIGARMNIFLKNPNSSMYFQNISNVGWFFILFIIIFLFFVYVLMFLKILKITKENFSANWYFSWFWFLLSLNSKDFSQDGDIYFISLKMNSWYLKESLWKHQTSKKTKFQSPVPW